MNKRCQLRQKLAEAALIRVAGAHDALGARLVEEAGFDAVWASGLEISASHGVPDASILSMTECLHAADIMNRASALPIIADCDSGYGGINNVLHVVREYERRGIAAVCIEDKLFPKRNSFYAGNQDLLPTDEFVAKLKAAKAAQADPDFIVIARTEAMVSGFGPDEVIRRAEAYAQAGADMILVHSKAKVLDEVRAVMALGCKFKPVAIIPTTYDVSATELAQLEVSMVIFANQGLRSAVRSMRETFRTLARTNQPSCVEENLATLKEIFALQRMENWEL